MVVSVKTRQITRNKLASFLDNQELIRAFENLTVDVGTTLPDAVNVNAESIDDILVDLDATGSTAMNALLQAALAMTVAQEANTQALTGQVASLISELADLRAQINDLKQGYIL